MKEKHINESQLKRCHFDPTNIFLSCAKAFLFVICNKHLRAQIAQSQLSYQHESRT